MLLCVATEDGLEFGGRTLSYDELSTCVSAVAQTTHVNQHIEQARSVIRTSARQMGACHIRRNDPGCLPSHILYGPKGHMGRLVLSRKPDECIIIGEDIIVTVVETRANLVRLAIQAPPDVAVDRSEIYERRRVKSGAAGPGTR